MSKANSSRLALGQGTITVCWWHPRWLAFKASFFVSALPTRAESFVFCSVSGESQASKVKFFQDKFIASDLGKGIFLCLSPKCILNENGRKTTSNEGDSVISVI